MQAHAARAPARIDLAGGTLDIWPVCLMLPGAVTVNLAIERRARARVRLRTDGRYVLRATDRRRTVRLRDREALLRETGLPLHREAALLFATGSGLELTTSSGVPAGSGLGGSSTLLVAAAWAAARAAGRVPRKDRILRLVMDAEARVIGVPTGAQDYLSALHGGLSAIRFPPGGPRRERLSADLAGVAARIVLVYTGEPHHSGTNNWHVTKAFLDGDPVVRARLGEVSAAAQRLEAELRRGDLDAAGDAIAEEWAARKALAPGVTTPRIESLGRAARRAGARAMKVCGAGGGGCVFFWCEDGRRAAVARALREAGAPPLPFRPAETGVEDDPPPPRGGR